VDCRICNSLGAHIRTAVLRKVVLAIRGKSQHDFFLDGSHGSDQLADVRTPRQIMEHEMVRSALCFALISTGMIGAALCLGAHNASAADDCITESNVVPPKGSRWHYDVDRATNRKCWHIVALSTAPHTPNRQRTSARSAPGLTGRSKHRASESGQAAQRTRVRSTAEQTAQRSRPPLSESDQAALFLEFLRWKEQQGTANSRAVEPPRRTVNP
jgi:hypothetical protein